MWKWFAEQPVATIVIIHGACEYHGRYKWLIEMWRTSGYNVIMGDLPGQGTSTRARGHINSFREYIDEVTLWVEEAKKMELPLFLLGHSMGGLIAITWYKENHSSPVKGIILSSPCLGVQVKVNKFLDIASKGLNKVLPTFRVDSGLTIEMATRNQEVIQADENDSLYITKVSVRWYRELLKAIEETAKPTEAYLNIPLLLMQAGDDKVVDKSMVINWFNQLKSHNKSYREWEGLYHEIFNEPEREDVFQAARNFTDQLIDTEKQQIER
ncbi:MULTISPECIES: alpha/beta hydrolase [Bacillus]|uniref:Phospholipase n=2 Tax=Bacillus TaxID=1386 RepID=A0A0M4FRP4_9BACI|nr:MULTISPECIES: alpha/beta hydrolase [Bacillus]ALC82084.1 phospholipase [Bacillus gobiensis]MBP1083432.1 lysophospholipase [Bacillus capparidis]MED1097864.1 alpha/beta hydrolase [Bacillus capparidis]